MAIIFDNSSVDYTPTTASSLTVNHAVGSGNNRGLVIFVYSLDADAIGNGLSGVTVDGNAATLVTARAISPTVHISLLTYIAPAVGTVSVVATATTTSALEVHILGYRELNQTNFINASATGTSTGDLTLNVTSSKDHCWIISAARNQTIGDMGAGTGTTIRETGIYMGSGDSNGSQSPPGSYSMGWTAASNTSNGVIAALLPYGAKHKHLLTLNVG